MSDSEFKNNRFILPQGWSIHSTGEVVNNRKYAPDVSIKDSHNRVICILESSSTGDRKTGIGELLQAHNYFTDSNVNGMQIVSLCGINKSSPRVNTQAGYLQDYFKYMQWNVNSIIKSFNDSVKILT